MDILLIDIGNTRVKLALTDGEALGPRRHLHTDKLTSASLREAIADWPCRRAVLCSVVPQRDDAVRVVFAKSLIEVRHTLPMDIGIDYPNPASIGADRLANALALKELYRCPGVAIDFGTAVTFDVVNQDGAYVGGVIAPGLEMMTDYLPERTALLPRMELTAWPPVIGKSTIQAMQAGAFYGYVGMTRHILANLTAKLGGEEPVIVATGGAAELLREALPEVRHFDPDLTIEGLRLVAVRHFFPQAARQSGLAGSIPPIFGPQAIDLLEIHQVPSEQKGVVDHADGGDLEVHPPDVPMFIRQFMEDEGGVAIEREDGEFAQGLERLLGDDDGGK